MRKKLVTVKKREKEGSMEERERGPRFIECCATGPDSADLVSFTNKGHALTHSQKPPHTQADSGHLHTHLT